jgi:hypothetical protein
MKKTIYSSDSENELEQKEKTTQKLEKLEQESTIILYELSTVFPFKLFPTKITIDADKITISEKTFIKTEYIFPMLIEDLLNVRVYANIFFASVQFELKGMETNPEIVTYLKRKEAEYARKIITGLMQVKRNNIDLSSLSKEDILDRLKTIGSETTSS